MENKMTYKIGWKVNRYRKDRWVGVVSSIKRSAYAQILFDKGAGWNGQLGRRTDK